MGEKVSEVLLLDLSFAGGWEHKLPVITYLLRDIGTTCILLRYEITAATDLTNGR